MSCSDCLVVENVPRCTENIIIGSITSLNTAVHVYVKNTATGKLDRFDVTSAAGTGLVTIDIGDRGYDSGIAHEVWITLASATSIYAQQTITIGSETTSCAQLMLEDAFDSDTDEQQAYTSQTLKVPA